MSGLEGLPAQVMLWVPATDVFRKKEVMRSSDNWKKPHVHRLWSTSGM